MNLKTTDFFWILPLALALGAGLSSLQPGNWLMGFASFSFLFILAFSLFTIALRWAASSLRPAQDDASLSTSNEGRLSAARSLLGLPSQLAKPGLHVGEHAPAEHFVVPFGFEQAFPHEPQFEVESRLASQPFPMRPSQLANPELHDWMLHAPEEQLPAAFAGLHGTPHAPQFVVVFSGVSQPLTGLPSQSPNPTGRCSLPIRATLKHSPRTPSASGLSASEAPPNMPAEPACLQRISGRGEECRPGSRSGATARGFGSQKRF